MAKSEDRFLVRESSDVSLDGEVWGLEQHLSEGGVRTYGIAGADGQAEAARKEAETARAAAETKRAEDEALRVEAETKRVTAEQERAAQQVKNNADQAANNAAAQGLIAVIVDDYDPDTLKPNGEGQNGKMYLVPMPEANAMAEAIPVSFALTPNGDGEYTARQVDARAAAAGDVYVEWLWINNQFERIGLSTATLDPITTDIIDAMVAGKNPQGKQVLTTTGLSYLWAKLKTAFAALTHKHPTSDVTGLDTALADKATKAEVDAVRESLSQVFDDMSDGNNGVADLNMVPAGVWSFSSGAKNAPCEKGMVVCLTSNSWHAQFAMAIYSSAAFIRNKGTGDWSAWTRL